MEHKALSVLPRQSQTQRSWTIDAPTWHHFVTVCECLCEGAGRIFESTVTPKGLILQALSISLCFSHKHSSQGHGEILEKNWWVLTFTALDSSKRLYRASNSFPNDTPGAASRKSGIFIFQPERLIGRWVGEPKKSERCIFFKCVTVWLCGSCFEPVISCFFSCFFSCFVLMYFVYDVFTVRTMWRSGPECINSFCFPTVSTGMDQNWTKTKWVYLLIYYQKILHLLNLT